LKGLKDEMPNNESTDKLRADLAEWARNQRPAAPTEPLPPGFDGDEKPQTLQTARALYLDSILKKAPGAMSQAERDYLRQSLRAGLPGLGY
jgi:hypothetical protein